MECKVRNCLYTISIILVLLVGCSPAKDETKSTRGNPPISSDGTLPGYPGNKNEQEKFKGFITDTPDPSITPLIVRVTHEDQLETIEITNISSSEVDISGYILYSVALEDRLIIPDTTILSPGEQYYVYNGSSDQNRSLIIWKSEFTVNNFEEQLILLNRAGRIIYYYTYYP